MLPDRVKSFLQGVDIATLRDRFGANMLPDRVKSFLQRADTPTLRYLAIGAGALAAGLVIGVGIGAWMAPQSMSNGVSLVTASGDERGVFKGSIIPIRRAVAAIPPGPGKAWQTPAKFTSTPSRGNWRHHAVAAPETAGRPMIAVLIDDLGLNRYNTRRTTALPAPLTLAFLTYAEDLARQTARARAAGHELLLHVPMEPVSEREDPGPNVLAAEHGPEEVLRRLRWGLGRFSGYVGVNNHMGSRFTTSVPAMTAVLSEIHKLGLAYVDSRTSRDSVTAGIARHLGLPHAVRDVFLDNHPVVEKVARQLRQAENVARERGYAVAIGHPRDGTLDALEVWLQDLEQRGFALVPVSTIIDLTGGVPGKTLRLSRAETSQ
ncbi:MAG TPA: divergent polysaccharide deacetylase family protein [Alphaproteobacteria bacterium]|nr:divergent polysaccharide deacetylase family protein [Alphaproteobacteria bacterium]